MSRGCRTRDEVAELGVEPDVGVRAVEPDHLEIPGHVLGQRHVVDGWEEGGALVVDIQHCKKEKG